LLNKPFLINNLTEKRKENIMLITKNTVITDTSKKFEYFVDVHVNGEYQVKRTDLINNLTDVIFISSSYADMLTFMYGIQKAVLG
jgi:hypothetical protein